MLNSVEWKYFKLEDLFEINYGRFIPSKHEYKPGDMFKTPYITTTEKNNGIMRYMNLEPDYNFEAITIATDGSIGEAFYQNKPFLASNITAVLKPLNKFNKYIALFLITILKREKYRYNYGRKWSINKIRNTFIKLPVNSDGDPNWEFMEEYMRKISKGNLEGFNLPKNKKRLSLDDRKWDDFKLEDLFEIETGKDLIIKNIKIGDIPVISHSSVNNGVSIRSKFIKNRKIYNCAKSITLADRGTFYATVQAEDYYLGTRVKSLISKSDDSSIYSLIFISTIINQEKYRYNYGRNATHRLPETIIKLPIKPKSSPDENSEPDWEFMENYIKGLPYTNKL